MKKRKTRFSALLLALLMLATLWAGPVSAGAEAPPDDGQTIIETPEPVALPDPIDTGGGYLDAQLTTDRVGGTAPMENLPAAYSSVEAGLVTPVKHQGSSQLCWDFAAISSMETSMITQGKATPESIDLSEQHLAYFFFNRQADPLDGTANDTVNLVLENVENYMDIPNNTSYLVPALANLQAATTESIAPFGYANPAPTVEARYAYASADAPFVHLKNTYQLSNSDAEHIKSLLQTYGSASIAYNSSSIYLNAATNSYYCPDDEVPITHAVTLVGWDDNYRRDNFRSNAKPANDGAWLIKNSWGTDSGVHGGYYWISYEDKSIENAVYFFECTPSDTGYQYCYQYDGGYYSLVYKGNSASGYDPKKISISNVFTTKQAGETLKAVSFYTRQPDTDYVVEIYTGLSSDYTKPTTGGTLAGQISGTSNYAGYHTIDLPAPVALEAGSLFSVVVHLALNENSTATDPISTPIDSSKMIGSTTNDDGVKVGKDYYETKVAARTGESFLSYNGTAWTASLPYNLRVKAFTEVTLDAPSGLSGQVVGQDVRLGWNAVPGADTYEVQVKEGDGYRTLGTSQETSYTVRAPAKNASYSYRVRAVGHLLGGLVEYGPYSANCAITVKELVSDIQMDSSLTLKEGATKTLSPTILPTNASDKSLGWHSSNTGVATVSGGRVVGKKAGKAIITATARDGGKASAKCTVTVTRKIPPVTKVKFPQSSLTLKAGKSLTLKAIAYTLDGSKAKLAYSSDKTSVARVSASGKITAKKAGKATLTAKAENGKKATLKVTVVKKNAKAVKVTKVTASVPKTMRVGQTKYITGKPAPAKATAAKVSYKSGKASVLSVDASGRLLAKKAGKATLTVKAGGKSKKYTVSVKK